MPSCITTRQSAAAASASAVDSGAGAGIVNMTTGTTTSGPMLGMPSAPLNGNMGSMQNTPPQPQPSPSINNNPMMSNPEAAQQFCLRWNSYPATVAAQLGLLRAAEDFVDVTLACDGRQLRAHKVVLSACSPYFMQLLKSTPCKHPVIFLKDVGFRQLVALLEFMYAGEVNVSQAELPALLRTAEALQVRGLADTTPNNNNNNDFPSPPKPGFPQNFGTNAGMEQNPLASPQSSQTQGETIDATAGTMFAAQNVSNSACDASSNACSNSSTTGKRSQNQTVGKEEESDSNDSQEFDMGCMDDAAKQDEYFNENGSISQQFDGTGEDLGQTFGDTGSFDLSQGDLANELLTGENHTDEDEEVDDDENSLDCSKDMSGFSNDGSFGQNLDLGTPNGDATGNAAGSSLSLLEPGNAMLKSGSGMPNLPPIPGLGGGRGRNRMARNMFPLQGTYHGAQQCPYCNKHLSNVGNWRKHVLTMHFAREKLFKCEMCPSSFRTTEYLQKHYVRVHNFPQKMTRKKIPEKS